MQHQRLAFKATLRNIEHGASTDLCAEFQRGLPWENRISPPACCGSCLVCGNRPSAQRRQTAAQTPRWRGEWTRPLAHPLRSSGCDRGGLGAGVCEILEHRLSYSSHGAARVCWEWTQDIRQCAQSADEAHCTLHLWPVAPGCATNAFGDNDLHPEDGCGNGQDSGCGT